MASLRTRFPIHDKDAPPIRLKEVTVRYNRRTALENVTLTLPIGQRVAVVGPNGAGKTTLFKVIGGILSPTSGTVSVYGHGPSGHICIAYVPQRSQVDWSFPVNVREVVMMGRIRKIGLFRWPRKPDWELVEELLQRVGMIEFGDRQIGELSGGQQQRIFLAQAIAQEAEVVMLDEPLTGLDLPSQEMIFRILDELAEQGVTVLVATHDLNMAAEKFDQVMLLNQRLIAIGTPSEVFNRQSLVKAYGGHVHVLHDTDGMLVLTDSCCEGEALNIDE